jgi:hypothetical protein
MIPLLLLTNQTNSYLGVGGDLLSHTSPNTPTMASTPDPTTSSLIIINSSNEGLSPRLKLVTMVTMHANISQTIYLKSENAILDLKDSHTPLIKNSKFFSLAIVNLNLAPIHPKLLSPIFIYQ